MTGHDVIASAARLGRSNRLRAGHAATSTLVLLALAACGGGDGIVQRDRCTVSAVAVSPSTTTLIVGDQTTLQAVPTSQNCQSTPATTWSSSATNVATVSGTGVVTSVTPGTATITATVAGEGGSASGTSVVTVRAANVGSIVITPPSSSLQAGQTVTLSVQVRDERGQTLTGRAVTFSTNAQNVATVTAAGVVTGVAPGTATITVTCEGVTQTVVITVTSRPPASIRLTILPSTTITPGTNTQATATVLDALGGVLAGEAVTWASLNTSVAVVNTQGVISGISPGQMVLRVTSVTNTSVSKDTVITVLAGAASRVDITLANTVNILQSATATAVVRDAAGVALPSAIVTWSSSQPTVATVGSTTGVVTGVTAGNTNIVATVVGSPSITGTKALTVLAPVASVNVAQSNVLLEPGPNPGVTSQQLTVTLRDAAQNVLTGRVITYASSNTSVATVSTSGLVSAVGVGTGTISVSSEGVTTTVPLIVARAFAVIEGNQPTNTNSYQPPQINSAGSAIFVQRLSVGQYRITINGVGLANSTIGRNFTALVNGTNVSINSQLLAPTAMCNLNRIDVTGPTIIEVLCNDPISLALKDAAFKAILVGDNSVGGSGSGAAFSLHNTFTGAPYTPFSAFSWNSGGGAMTVTPAFGAPAFNNTQARHTMGFTFAFQHALTTAITNNPGESCEIQAQVLSSQFTDVVCFDRSGPVNAVHTVLKLSSGRPGQNGGLAFIDGVTGVASAQGFNSGGGTVVASRTGAGKYTIVFGGMVATGAIGVIATPWGASGWAACSHFVASMNPVTIDVACYNSAGAFTNAGPGLTVLVLQ